MTANKSIPPPSLDKQTRSQTPYTLTATLRSPCAQPNTAPPPHPPPRNERKKRRYNYNQTDIISAHSHCTVRLAVTLTSWVPMPLRAVQTYTPLSSHLAITLYVRGGQLAVHLRPVGSANQPHCGCGSAIAGSTVKRHSLGVMNHHVALLTVQCQRDLAGWVWKISRHMLANTHVLNTCGITACNTNVWLKHGMQMCVSK